MAGIARGCWILTSGYIRECSKREKWVDEADFVAEFFEWKEGPKNARKKRQELGEGL